MRKVATNENLRKVLLEELNALRSGKSDIKRTNAVVSLTGKLIQSAKLDITYRRTSRGLRTFRF